MQLKGLVKFFTVALILISLYQLSFTFLVRNVEKASRAKAEKQARVINPAAKGEELNALIEKRYEAITDSLQGEKVVRMLFKKYTYQEAKAQELNLGNNADFVPQTGDALSRIHAATDKVEANLKADVPKEGFAVQLAAFSDDKGANALGNRLKQSGYPVYTEPLKTSRGTLWRVRVGPYPSREAATVVRDKLKGEGQNGIVAPAK